MNQYIVRAYWSCRSNGMKTAKFYKEQGITLNDSHHAKPDTALRILDSILAQAKDWQDVDSWETRELVPRCVNCTFFANKIGRAPCSVNANSNLIMEALRPLIRQSGITIYEEVSALRKELDDFTLMYNARELAA